MLSECAQQFHSEYWNRFLQLDALPGANPPLVTSYDKQWWDTADIFSYLPNLQGRNVTGELG